MACAAGLEAVRQIVDEGALDNGRERGKQLRAGMEELEARYEQIGRVDGHGMLQGVEFVSDRATRSAYPASNLLCRAVGQTAKRNGLIARMGDHTYVLAPPLVSTEEEIDEMLDILDASIAETLETFEE